MTVNPVLAAQRSTATRGVRTLPAPAAVLLSAALAGLITWLVFEIQAVLSGREGVLYIRPYGIAYIVPVAALTALGGWRYGLLIVVMSLCCSAFFLMEPYVSFQVAHTRDRVELIF